jgi:hypothetical protein
MARFFEIELHKFKEKNNELQEEFNKEHDENK